MKNDIPSQLKHDSNLSVLRYLEGRSAHSDLAEVFLRALSGLDKAIIFTPTDRPFAYSFTHTNNIIFGFCESMQSITLLLPQDFHVLASTDGGTPHRVLAKEGWIDFPVFDLHRKPDCAGWVKHAYRNALR